jgi:hypothetical protein
VYDLRFRGSFSIKAVAPALAPEVGYGDLPVRDGLAAANAYEALLRELAPADPSDAAVGPSPDVAVGSSPDVAVGLGRRSRVLTDLRAYCARDTLAMVALHRALRRLSDPRP